MGDFEMYNDRAVVRAWLLALVAVAIWFVAKYESASPAILDANAPAAAFSSGRAYDTLERILGPERPHPAGTAENAAVRARILKELDALGVKASTYTGLGCNGERTYRVACATVTDIIAQAVPGTGKAIILLAHYDSVPAGPGAADDESGVATVLESIRALKARGGASDHPVLAVFTDGEEYGLLGAASFLHNPALEARVGAVVNVEARGNQGPSLLFQTSPGNGPIVDLYAASVRHYATSSLFVEIYKALPNDTDLTLFLHAGFPSFNFAFAENIAHYHTPLDTRAHLSRETLQWHGENLLGVASSLEHTDFAALKGSDKVYLSIFGGLLPRMPQSWALPLAILVFVMLTIAAFLAPGEPMGWGRKLAAFAIPPALIAGSVLVGWLLHTIAQLVSGMPDPSFAYPMALRIALAFGVWGVVLLVSHISTLRASAASVWLWLAGFGIATAAFLPGLSPYFLFPALIAAVLLLVTARTLGSWNSGVGRVASRIAALPPAIIWISLVATGETLMGLKLHPLFTLPAALGMAALVPLFAARPMPRNGWIASITIAFVVALGAAVFAGMQPAYSEIAPQRLNLSYVEDSGHAYWAADATAPLPASLRAAAKFADKPDYPYPGAYQQAYIAQAGATRFPAPSATISEGTPNNATRAITVTFQGSVDASQMFLVVPKEADLRSLDTGDQHFAIQPDMAFGGNKVFLCMTPDCAHASVTLHVGSKASFEMTVAEFRLGLPAFGAALAAARPKTAVPSRMGDGVVLIAKVKVPGG